MWRGRTKSRMKNRTRSYLHFSIELLIDKFVFGVVTCQLLFVRWNLFWVCISLCVCVLPSFAMSIHIHTHTANSTNEFHFWQMIGMLISLVAKMYDQILFLKKRDFSHVICDFVMILGCFLFSFFLSVRSLYFGGLLLFLYRSSSIEFNLTGG